MDQLTPQIARILAPNPSPMTYTGTNTYLIGRRSLAVIDPGPVIDSHRQAIMEAIGGRRVDAILVTHSHVDHSPMAGILAQDLAAPIMAYGDSSAGRSAVMNDLAAQGLAGGGEGVDADFAPDVVLADGDTITGDGWSLTALWTPGHFGNHMSFAMGDTLFSGDLVMDWASSLVSPPDGDLTDFMASLRRLQDMPWSQFLPGHGAPITAPADRLAWLIAHRESREAQLLAALSATPQSLTALTETVYTDIEPAMLPAAARNLFAHLVDLHGKHRVQAHPYLSVDALFSTE